METSKARAILYQAGLDLVREGLVARTWGNISVRLDSSRFLITPSGRTYEALTPEEMVVVNIDALTHEGNLKPSSEKGMHAEIYKRRPEIMAVVHTHQLQASTVAAARKEVTGLSTDEARELGESVQCAAYALPGTKKLKMAAAEALVEDRKAALLANHGAVCVGQTMEEAFNVARTLEKACEAFIARSFAERHGKPGLCIEEMHAHYLTHQRNEGVAPMTVQATSEEICRWARALVSQGVASDETGCLSLRVGQRMLITPEGLKLSELKNEDICAVDLTSCTPEHGPIPDRRFALHAAIYKKRKKMSALIHAESLSILTSSRAGLDVPSLLDDMAQIVGVSAKVATTWPYRGVSPVITALKGRHAVLLKNTGALCGGTRLDDALAVAQVLEKGCKAFIESSFLGGGVQIPPVEALLMRTVYHLTYSKQKTASAMPILFTPGSLPPGAKV